MPLPKEVIEALPEDIRDDPSLADINDVPTLAKRFLDTKKFVGASIRPPGPDATPEAKKEFVEKMLKHDPDLVHASDEAELWKRLGKPAKPEEYELPEEAKIAGLNENEVRLLAATAGLTKKQAVDLAKVMANGTLAKKQARDAEAAALKAELGGAYEERTAAARAAAVKMGFTAEEAAALPPKALRAFVSVAKALGGERVDLKNQNGGGGGRLTPAEARAQLAEIRADPVYWNRAQNPLKHDILKNKVVELTGMAFPE